ncbi:RDD family protein [candidate division WOR-3 bacterium]|nr:RDD family protein [candidate division WOR-3 bacterium]
MKRKFIPKRIFQAVSLSVMALCFVLTVFIVFTSRAPYTFFMENIFEKPGPYEAVLSFLLTFLVLILGSLPFLILLRLFSDVPALNERLRKDPLFGSPPAEYSGKYEIPSPWLRILALFIDRMLSVLLVLAGIPFVVLAESSEPGYLQVPAKSLFFILLTAAVFYSYCRDAFKGKSLGRKMLGMKVVDEKTGKPIKFWKSFLREIGLHFAPLLAIELVFIFTKPGGRRTGDVWAKSIVIKES